MRYQIGGDEVRYDEGTVRGVVQGVQKKHEWQASFHPISSSSSASGSSRDRSSSQRVVLIISIVHTLLLVTTHAVIECGMVAMFYVSALKSILVANSSLLSICF